MDSVEHGFQCFQGLDTPRPGRLVVRIGQRGQDGGVRHELRGFRQGLDERNIAAVRAAAKCLAVDELADIHDELVQQDDARGEALEQGDEDFLAR